MRPVTPAVIKLALTIADSCARSDIETCCEGDPNGWDVNSPAPIDKPYVDQAVEYLELRGLLQRCHERPHVVTFPEWPE